MVEEQLEQIIRILRIIFGAAGRECFPVLSQGGGVDGVKNQKVVLQERIDQKTPRLLQTDGNGLSDKAGAQGSSPGLKGFWGVREDARLCLTGRHVKQTDIMFGIGPINGDQGSKLFHISSSCWGDTVHSARGTCSRQLSEIVLVESCSRTSSEYSLRSDSHREVRSSGSKRRHRCGVQIRHSPAHVPSSSHHLRLERVTRPRQRDEPGIPITSITLPARRAKRNTAEKSTWDAGHVGAVRSVNRVGGTT